MSGISGQGHSCLTHFIMLLFFALARLVSPSSALRPVVQQQQRLESGRLSFEHSKMQELVEAQGYPLEEHFVETGDGYVLGVYRIPYGRNVGITLPPQRGTPVLLQHGLLDSSATWVVNFPQQSLGFILADAGYDVWLSNSRGNAFSRNHTGLQPSSAAFWDFSFDDMADYDLPAAINYILTTTGYPKLAYVGHSQGCTQALAAFASRPPLQPKVSIFVALAPAAFVRFTSSVPMLVLAQLQADQLVNVLGEHEFLPARKAMAELFGGVCRAAPLACLSVLTAICGFNADNLNATRLPTYVAYAPSGTSVKNMVHWAQLIRRSAQHREPLFTRYDYGAACNTPSGGFRTCNRRVYGTEDPPAFNLSAIVDVPVAVFSGVQDKLADPVDVQSLLERLPSVVFTHSELSYEHIDFTWGLSSAQRIYPAVLDLLKQYHSYPDT